MMHKVNYAYKFRPCDNIPDDNKRSCISVSKMYMRTCCTHRNNNHSVVNVCGISGELQVSNNENVFKCPSPWSGKIPRNTQIPDT